MYIVESPNPAAPEQNDYYLLDSLEQPGQLDSYRTRMCGILMLYLAIERAEDSSGTFGELITVLALGQEKIPAQLVPTFNVATEIARQVMHKVQDMEANTDGEGADYSATVEAERWTEAEGPDATIIRLDEEGYRTTLEDGEVQRYVSDSYWTIYEWRSPQMETVVKLEQDDRVNAWAESYKVTWDANGRPTVASSEHHITLGKVDESGSFNPVLTFLPTKNENS